MSSMKLGEALTRTIDALEESAAGSSHSGSTICNMDMNAEKASSPVPSSS